MKTLSVAIIARDEERHIDGCLASLAGLADEIVVLLDDRSRDATAAICERYQAVVYRLPWLGFPAQRNQALDLCRCPWVLFVDADERVTPDLAQEIRELLAVETTYDGFWIPRHNLFFGRQVCGGGWYPDHQLRLLRRSSARYDESRLVHELVQLVGEAGYLNEHLLHYNIERLDELWRKQRAYAIAEAQTLYIQGQRAKWRNFVARPLREFLRRFVFLAGWHDGALGLLLCATLAWFELIKFIHLKGLDYTGMAEVPQALASPAADEPLAYSTDIAVIIVSWNVRNLLRRAIATTIASLEGRRSYRLIVVDNASNDGSVAMVRAEFPQVEIIEAGANLGFSAGNNLALRAVGSSARYLMLLNPDTEVVGDAIVRLAEYLDRHPETVVVGPQLRYGDGNLQSSRRRFPTPSTYIWESTPLEQWWPTNPWAWRYRCEDQPADQVQPVGWLVGAALMVRQTAVAQAGLLDEGFFMYSEELEWQSRIQNGASVRARRIVYLPEATIIHYEGRSSEQVSLRRHVLFQQSKIRLARLRHGPAFAVALRLFLLVCYLLQLLSEAAKWLLGHRRDLRRQRVGLYLDVIRAL